MQDKTTIVETFLEDHKAFEDGQMSDDQIQVKLDQMKATISFWDFAKAFGEYQSRTGAFKWQYSALSFVLWSYAKSYYCMARSMRPDND